MVRFNWSRLVFCVHRGAETTALLASLGNYHLVLMFPGSIRFQLFEVVGISRFVICNVGMEYFEFEPINKMLLLPS